MVQKIKRNPRAWMIVLLAVCMGLILFGGISYLTSLRDNLREQSIQNVLTVTMQQQQAFDNFISEDRERLHSYAEYFALGRSDQVADIRQKLDLFGEVDAFYTVIDLETGRFCGSKSDQIYTLAEEELATYRALSGSGVRDPYSGLYTQDTMFGYYECFTFADGVPGLVQKSYDRSKVSKTFSLSFYNDRGLAYVVNQRGDILLRSIGKINDQLYENIFDVLTGAYGEQTAIDEFMQALRTQESGSMTFTGSRGTYIYTYVPVNNVEQWYLVSIVPQTAIMDEAEQILHDSQVAMIFLVMILVVCAIFVLLLWTTHREIREKEQRIDYQVQLFDIFSTYLSQNTDDVYMMLDTESNTLDYVSPNLERVFGITPEEIMANPRSFEAAYRPGDLDALKSLRQLEPGGGTEAVQTQWLHPKTGERKWFQESVYCVQVQNRKKLVVYVSDRTQDRKAQNDLAEALRMAQVASRAKSAFLSNVSHDIRTPMNAIVGFLTLMQNEADNPAMVREYAQRIDAASRHLLGLINDVLDMNKIESGSATLNISELNVAEIIDEINTIIRPQAKARRQHFEISVSPIACERLRGDKLRINQILINLLSNAVKYTQEGGHISLAVEELPQVVDSHTRLRFTIRDDGFGMSEEYQQVIFDPFTREESTVTRQIQGTGLGMPITRSLVDLMGGTIQVSSRLGKGSVFTVELELPIQEQEADPSFWTDHGVLRIIVADDDEEICQNIVRAMASTPVEVVWETSGEAALQNMQKARSAGRPYDLILLDWKMPAQNGLDTARQIRAEYPEKIPIFLLTAYDWSDIEQEAAGIGIDSLLPKPFFLSSLQEAVRRLRGGQNKLEDVHGLVTGRHILVVDDIEVNQIVLVKILSTLGARCDVAGNGQEALELFEQSEGDPFDLILMDVQMPVLDGYSATRAIRAGGRPDARTIPIIAMTANAFVDDVRDAIDAGMNAHVAKPIQMDKLKAAIRQVMEAHNTSAAGQKI